MGDTLGGSVVDTDPKLKCGYCTATSAKLMAVLSTIAPEFSLSTVEILFVVYIYVSRQCANIFDRRDLNPLL